MLENIKLLSKLIIIDDKPKKDSILDMKIKENKRLYLFNDSRTTKRIKISNYFINPIKNKDKSKKETRKYAKIIIMFILYFIICCLLIIFLKKIIIKFKYKENSNYLNHSPSFQFSNLHSFNVYEFKYLKDRFFSINDFNYLFSFIFNTVKVYYNIGIFDEKKSLILPSDLPLYDDIHILCHFEIINQNLTIDSLANIYKNRFFNCIEFFKINEKVKFGIKILKGKSSEYMNLYQSTEEIFNYNKINFLNDKIFSPNLIKKGHEVLLQMLKNEKLNKKLRLKSIYNKYPLCNLKRNSVLKEGEWTFQNLYNHYFCFCKGKKCSFEKLTQICKFNFYKFIIDKNRYEYKKTDYLFVDFIFKEYGEDDTFPVFKEFGIDNTAHFLTEKTEIYKKYCANNTKCQKIIPMNRKLYHLYGDFIEKYLTLLLKLKAVISARENPFYIISNLFYNIEYITYIAVGHGLCYFKDFLYYKYQIYGVKMNNKLLIPPSKILINLVKRYGWKEEDLIKINLPRWDKFNSKIFKKKERIKSNSILVMFTWRQLKSGKSISPYYFRNITDLITNELLMKEFKKRNITLYFTMHRSLYFKYRKQYKQIEYDSDFIFINQKQISECLGKIDLIITDFSSVVFDVMYRKKPFIIYFPDIDEPNIDNIYTKNYIYVIKTMKKTKFGFKNVYFHIDETIKKIIYYVENNFTVENELKSFYDSFIPNRGKRIQNFIEYLKKLS